MLFFHVVLSTSSDYGTGTYLFKLGTVPVRCLLNPRDYLLGTFLLFQVRSGRVLDGEAVQVPPGGEHQGQHGQGAQAAHQRGSHHRGGYTSTYPVPIYLSGLRIRSIF